jgi:hypothetical protein
MICSIIEDVDTALQYMYRIKAINLQPAGLLILLEIPKAREECKNIDFVMKPLISQAGNNIIITIIDRLT